MVDWNDPAARAFHIETVGPEEYAKQFAQHVADSTITTINGHAIRPVMTRFGKLYQVGSTGTGYGTLDLAIAYAEEIDHG